MQKSKMGKTLVFLLITALPFLTNYFFPVMVVIKKPYSYSGIVIIIIGFFIAIKASREFKNAGNNYNLKEDSAKLMTDGIFNCSRNPMYLGMMLWFTGLAVFLGSLTSFIYPVFFFILANKMISYEERKLEKIYGDQYNNYRKRVRRWL